MEVSTAVVGGGRDRGAAVRGDGRGIEGVRRMVVRVGEAEGQCGRCRR